LPFKDFVDLHQIIVMSQMAVRVDVPVQRLILEGMGIVVLGSVVQHAIQKDYLEDVAQNMGTLMEMKIHI